MGKLFEHGKPEPVSEFVLTWIPASGENPQEVPVGRRIQLAGVPGTFELVKRRNALSGTEAGQIADAIHRATENPGQTIEIKVVGQGSGKFAELIRDGIVQFPGGAE